MATLDVMYVADWNSEGAQQAFEFMLSWEGGKGTLAFKYTAADQRLLPKESVQFYNNTRAVCSSWYRASLRLFKEWTLTFTFNGGRYAFTCRQAWVIFNNNINVGRPQFEYFKQYQSYSISELLQDKSLLRQDALVYSYATQEQHAHYCGRWAHEKKHYEARSKQLLVAFERNDAGTGRARLSKRGFLYYK